MHDTFAAVYRITFHRMLVDERPSKSEGQGVDEAIDREQIKASALSFVLHSHGMVSGLFPGLHPHLLCFCCLL